MRYRSRHRPGIATAWHSRARGAAPAARAAPGYVWVTSERSRRLAEFRGETVEQFSAKFVRRVGDRSA